MAIAETDLKELIRAGFSDDPDIRIDVLDKTGMNDHYIIRVVTPSFEGVGIMDRHRMVMRCLEPAMGDGRLHAVEIQTGI